tara:strand:+ start:5456 stop:5719 length:264 start_codon:yes stop_codon:yes gene_type:complete
MKMPKYCYFCESCKTGFETSHSIKERLKKCELCDAHALRKLPSMPIYLTKSQEGKDKKVGSLVEEAIEENRNLLHSEQERLKKVEYK